MLIKVSIISHQGTSFYFDIEYWYLYASKAHHVSFDTRVTIESTVLHFHSLSGQPSTGVSPL